MEQQTGSKLGKEYIKAVYSHLAYLTYMQSTSWEMLGWMNQAGIKIAERNINNLGYADDTTLMAESEEELNNSGETKMWRTFLPWTIHKILAAFHVNIKS